MFNPDDPFEKQKEKIKKELLEERRAIQEEGCERAMTQASQACNVSKEIPKGARDLIEKFKKEIGLGNDQTTSDERSSSSPPNPPIPRFPF